MDTIRPVLGLGMLAAALVVVGCDRSESASTDSTAKSPEFQSAAGEVPECCAPPDTIIRRTPGETAAEAEAEAASVAEAADEALFAQNAADLIAKIGSIQTSLDSSIDGTIIGRKVNFDLEFTNEDGQKVNLARDYAGQTLVISTVFTSCPTPTACPRITADFAEMARNLPSEHADKVRFLLISFDPLNDTPEVLRAFGRTHGVDFERVDLLVSDVETIKRLMVRELEIPISIDASNDSFANHALMAHIVNADGYVVVERTASSSAKIAMLLDEALRAARMLFTPPDNGQ